MPYKDHNNEQARQRRRYAEGHGRVYLEAASWADGQIATLRGMGIQHTTVEWALLRHDLVKSRLSKNTLEALNTPSE